MTQSLEGQIGKYIFSLIGEHKAVLHVGCGDGSVTRYFSNGNRVVGVDSDANALMRAATISGIETIFMDFSGDWHELHGRKFDYVVAGDVLGKFPEDVAEKVSRHLVQGGTVLVSVPSAVAGTGAIARALEKNFSQVGTIGLGRFWFLARLFPGLFASVIVFVCRKNS